VIPCGNSAGKEGASSDDAKEGRNPQESCLGVHVNLLSEIWLDSERLVSSFIRLIDNECRDRDLHTTKFSLPA
jgi:hypothetical protein